MEQVRSPFRIGLPTAASLLVNGLMIAALVNLGMGRQQRRVESPSLKVMSLALLKGAEDGEEKAETPNRSQAEPHEQPQPQISAAPPVPSLVAPPPSLPQAASPAPAPVAPTAAPKAASAMAAPPVMAPAPRKGAADGLDADAPPGNSRAYAARVRSWLYAHKIYPRRAKMRREEGVVRVRFVIDRAGVLLEGQVVQSSGCSSLDEEADAMMHRASPYPKAPREVPGERIEFIAPIEFMLPI